MGRLLTRDGEPTAKSIVDILTYDFERASVWTNVYPPIFRNIMGINGVDENGPIYFYGGYHERGLVNPDDSSKAYLIQAEKKVLGVIPNVVNLFTDQDKVLSENRFLWDGSFEEILDEFRKEGYRLENVEV